jgi:hypothetical protein
MTVRELIELLQNLPQNLDVKIPSSTGGVSHVNEVDTSIERSHYDSDFDHVVVVIQ